MDQFGDGVDQARPAHPDRLAVADHVQRQPVVADLDALDRAVGGAHPAADLRGLERRPGGSGGRHHAIDGAERDLRIGADVDEQPQAAVTGQPRGEHAGDDVAADVGPQRGEDERRSPRMDGHPEVRRARGRQLVGHDHERRHRQRLGVDAERQLHHRHVPADGDLVDLLGGHLGLGQHLGGQLRHRLVRAVAQLSHRLGIHHRRRDPGDHVGAEGLLAVEHRTDRGRLAGVQVQQRRHHRRRAQIKRDREPPGRRVAGLQRDQLPVTDDRGHVEERCAQHPAELAQQLQRGVGLQVVQPGQHALEVRDLVLQRRLGRARDGASAPPGAG